MVDRGSKGAGGIPGQTSAPIRGLPPRPPHVLLVEDDASLRLVTRLACESAGFGVSEATTGAAALAAMAAARPDVVLLDLMLPDTDGFDVCRAIRRSDTFVPIIMLTARGDETDKVVGLELGADDYLTKPFGTRELVARIRVQLRKAQTANAGDSTALSVPIESPSHEGAGPALNRDDHGVLHVGALRIIPDEREVDVAGRTVMLTRTEFDILLCLARHAGKALSRAQIINTVWGYDTPGDDRLVDSHIKNLRKKLESFGDDRPHITTVSQIGYKLVRP